MKTAALTLSILASVLTLAAEDVRIQKVFPVSRAVRLRIASGDCLVAGSPDGKIHVDVVHSCDPATYEPTFTEGGDTLDLGEKHHTHSTRGQVRWTLGIPDGLSFEFRAGSGSLKVKGPRVDAKANTGSGRIEIQNARGDFRVNTGSGSIRVQDCDGLLLSASTASGDHDVQKVKGKVDLRSGSGHISVADTEGDVSITVASGRIGLRNTRGNLGASTGSGSIRGENLTLVERGTFTSGSGDVDLDVPDGEGYRLKASAGFGDVTVRLNGRPPKGFFEFSTSKRHGSIVSCEPFDREDELPNPGGSDTTLRKSFARGKSTSQAVLRTSSGRIELRR